MNIQEILRQYPFITEDIQDLQKELNKFLDMQEDLRQRSIKAQHITDMPHGTGVGDNVLDKVIILFDNYQQKIDNLAEQINELLDRKKWLDKAYAELNDTERRVLLMKYNKNLSYRKIEYICRINRKTLPDFIKDAETKVKRLLL